ncbi:maleylpyruvate isomerase N-terminal domain-containing protein [Phycicoccus sp. KQZ13P-1]|uniref:maleylpyruvate isomerase N-terminal domain-containing protein n=1 Tax=Phycicoccus mangrovi TaxID=2840470 RepID=UPI001C003D9F|nr:maleylpyruvate isomerase N-terminal domain-containing protein [Phycicoccus mangrovi]MBT9257537.1 maleylpyruvate isomerase N-terminal domain-containing protein [Phycicoccus mangrovi]
MPALTVPHAEALDAFRASVAAFADAVRDLPEVALFEPSRCAGWTRFDVVAHVLAGWEELLGGFAQRTAGPATVDAASYWAAYAEAGSGHDPVLVLMDQRRWTDAHRRPAAAVARLVDVVHLVDLDLGATPPPAALDLARRTAEALPRAAVPWDPEALA